MLMSMKKFLIIFCLTLGASFIFASEDLEGKKGFVHFSFGPTFDSNLEIRNHQFIPALGKYNLYGWKKCSISLGLGKGSFLTIDHECLPLRRDRWSAGINTSLLFGFNVKENITSDNKGRSSNWQLAGGGQIGLSTRYLISPSMDIGVQLGVFSTALFESLSDLGSNFLFYLDAGFRYYF